MREIVIARDFSRFPGGRYRRHGAGSGEEFREKFLAPALDVEEEVEVVFDGTSGYPPSFTEEAFGGLVRSGKSVSELRKKLRLKARTPEFETYVEQAWRFIEEQGIRTQR